MDLMLKYNEVHIWNIFQINAS